MFKKYKETGIFDKNEIYPYVTEGIGEDFLPKNVDFSLIDHFEKVTDKDAAIMTRRIAREEGIFAGNSAGAAMAGLLQLRDRFTKDDVVVVIFHDHGTRYLGKMFNDDWMRKKGYLDKAGLTARDLVASRPSTPLFTLDRHDTVSRAIEVMTEHDYSQIPVTDGGRFIGSVSETRLYQAIVKDPDVKGRADRDDHAAGVSVRGHLDGPRRAGDDDHAGEPGRARARLQEPGDVHHHALGRDSRAWLTDPSARPDRARRPRACAAS